MIRAIGPLRYAWIYTRSMRLPRSGPLLGASSNQLGALRRRWRLRPQQEDLQAGLVDYLAIPPYPPRTSAAIVVIGPCSTRLSRRGNPLWKLVRQGYCHSNPSSGHIPLL